MPKKQDQSKATATGRPRPARRIHDESPDQVSGKLAEIAACPKCGASYRNGRWTWKKAAIDAYEKVCPACDRIDTDYPAGVLHVGGGFATAHRRDLIGLIRNIEVRERDEHPLKRVMGIADEGAGFVVTTTDANLAQSLGRALVKAYDGQLEHPPTTSDKENVVRVHWTRD